MKRRSEEECDAGSFEAALDHLRLGRDAHSERLEQVRASTLARYRSIAMLWDLDTAGREHQCRDCRDVERVRAISTGPARVEHRRMRSRQSRRAPPHRLTHPAP